MRRDPSVHYMHRWQQKPRRECEKEDASNKGYALKLACSLNLTSEQQAILQDISERSIDQQITFISEEVKDVKWSLWEVPREVARHFSRIALKLLLDLTSDSLFTDSKINVFKFFMYLKGHEKELGLKSWWRLDTLRALEVASQKSFSEGRRQIIEKIKVSIEKRMHLSELAASLGAKDPSVIELNTFALLRDVYLRNGRKGFFDRIDRKLAELRSSCDTEMQFQLVRLEDASRFPERSTVLALEKRKCVEELARSRHTKKLKRLQAAV